MTKPAPRRLRRILLNLALLGFAGFNAVSFMQARSFTHYERSGQRTKIPERMSAWDKARVLLCGATMPRPKNHAKPSDEGLPFTTHKFPGAHGLSIEAWRVEGRAGRPVVLMFPGYAAPKDMFLPAARELHAMGCELWLVDFHGAGGSAGDTTSIGWDEADDVAAAVSAARQLAPDAPVVLYGCSMGAAAILRAVHLGAVKPDALILECPFDRLVTTVGNRFQSMGVPAFPLAHALVFWGGVQGGFDGFAHNPVEYARAVRCPTLLMGGEHDRRVGMPAARAIASALGEHGTFKVFAGQGHVGYFHRAPAEWRRTVRDFLFERSPQPATPRADAASVAPTRG